MSAADAFTRATINALSVSVRLTGPLADLMYRVWPSTLSMVPATRWVCCWAHAVETANTAAKPAAAIIRIVLMFDLQRGNVRAEHTPVGPDGETGAVSFRGRFQLAIIPRRRPILRTSSSLFAKMIRIKSGHGVTCRGDRPSRESAPKHIIDGGGVRRGGDAKKGRTSRASSTGIGIIHPARAIAGVGADGKIPHRRSDHRRYSSGDPARRIDIDARGAALPEPHQGVQRHVRQSTRRSARGRTDRAHQECASTQCLDDFEFKTGQTRKVGL